MRMSGQYGHGLWCSFGFPPFGMRFWSGRPWGLGFPHREDYLHMLEAYKGELEELQREVADELEEVGREIEKLKR